MILLFRARRSGFVWWRIFEYFRTLLTKRLTVVGAFFGLGRWLLLLFFSILVFTSSERVHVDVEEVEDRLYFELGQLADLKYPTSTRLAAATKIGAASLVLLEQYKLLKLDCPHEQLDPRENNGQDQPNEPHAKDTVVLASTVSMNVCFVATIITVGVRMWRKRRHLINNPTEVAAELTTIITSASPSPATISTPPPSSSPTKLPSSSSLKPPSLHRRRAYSCSRIHSS